jgi:hypothetical protein
MRLFGQGVLKPGHVCIGAAAFAAVSAATLQLAILLARQTPRSPAQVAHAGTGDPRSIAVQKTATAAALRVFNAMLLALGGLVLCASVLIFPATLDKVGVALMLGVCTTACALAANVMLTTLEVERRKKPRRKPKGAKGH